MARPEITRELVLNPDNGKYEWKTVVDSTGGAGSGTVAMITSSDSSVTIANGAGPTVDLTVTGGGGSQNLDSVLTNGNDASGFTIENLAEPAGAQDAATKNYVDTHGGGPPSGPAAGVLSGTYPNPGFAVDMATQAELDAEAAARAAADATLTPQSRTLTAGTGLTGGGNLSANRTFAVAYGSTAGTAAEGNDARLTNSRVPTGTAGGDLTGTYPNPTIANLAVDTANISSGAAANGTVMTANGGGGVTFAAPAGGAPSGAAGGDLTGSYPDPTITSGSAGAGNVLTADGASGTVWATSLSGPLLPAELFGFVGDGVTDNLAAWNAMIAIFATGESKCGVWFDAGDFYFSDTLACVGLNTGPGTGLEFLRFVGASPPIYNQTPNPVKNTIWTFGKNDGGDIFLDCQDVGNTQQAGIYFEMINFVNAGHADNICHAWDQVNNFRVEKCGFPSASTGWGRIAVSYSHPDGAHLKYVDCLAITPQNKIAIEILGNPTGEIPGAGICIEGGNWSGTGTGSQFLVGGEFADAATLCGDLKVDGFYGGAVDWQGQHLMIDLFRVESSGDTVFPATDASHPPIKIWGTGYPSGNFNLIDRVVIIGRGGGVPIYISSTADHNFVGAGIYDNFEGGSTGYVQCDTTYSAVDGLNQVLNRPIHLGAGDGLNWIVNVPTADPHVVGQVWASSGVLTVSAG